MFRVTNQMIEFTNVINLMFWSSGAQQIVKSEKTLTTSF